ncbi:MAG TPA: alpha/beta hydrolase [Streptosporangiaceae bacterium]
MNDVGELKEYVGVHARGQRIRQYQQLLDLIHSDADGGAGSWVGEWSRVAALLEAQGRDLAAGRHYAMARFPYVDGPARQEALERCVSAVDRWRTGRGDIQSLDADLKEGKVRCWASGLSETDRKPLLLIMGGIVTVKEQWAPMLALTRRLGMAGLVTEMPGTGENTLRYEPESWRMLSGLLDAVADRADVTQTYAVALSFSGHLALRCAVDDPRMRAVITVGAPIGAFFTDAAWQQRLPKITIDTLAHMIGVTPGQVVGNLGDWALSKAQLASLDIPVSYVASRRDEIIPADDAQLLESHVRRLDLVEYDDVHGAPGHVTGTQLWVAASLLRSRGVRDIRGAIAGLLLRTLRFSRRR